MISPLLTDELTSMVTNVESDKILKYFELFVGYVDNRNLDKIYEILQKKENPSSELIREIVLEAKTNQKLFQFIEVLLQKF
jgi:hypothetical protein